MFTLSCVRVGGCAVWVRENLSAAELMRSIPHIDCGCEYIVSRGRDMLYRVYHGSRHREVIWEG